MLDFGVYRWLLVFENLNLAGFWMLIACLRYRNLKLGYIIVCLPTVFAKFVQKARFESKHVTQGLKKPNFYNVVNNPAVNHCTIV